MFLGAGGIAEQTRRLGGAHKTFIAFDVIGGVQVHGGKGEVDNVLHGVEFAGGENVIASGVLLQCEPHSAHGVTGIAPIALGTGVAQQQFFLPTGLDGGGGTTDFSRHKILTASAVT